GGWAWGDPLTSYALVGGAPFVKQKRQFYGLDRWSRRRLRRYGKRLCAHRIPLHELHNGRLHERRHRFCRAAQSFTDKRSAGGPCIQIWWSSDTIKFKMFQICCRRFRAGFAHSVTNKSEVVTTG